MKKIVKPLTLLFFLPVLILLSFLTASKLSAQGNLLITPKRVVFEGNKRSEELNLANIGKDTATYIISFIQYRMEEDGKFVKITQPDPGQNFADKNLRFFPRTVTLGPNEAQTVKVQLTKANDLAPGEYRSHLYFRASPPEKPLGDIEPEKDSVLSVRLTPIFGISIPVIIRKGESDATVSIADVKFQQNDSLRAVDITFNRSGNMSVYGDVGIDYISPEGKVTRVGGVKGLAVYTPNTVRRFHIVLNNVTGINFRTGKLRAVYEDQSSRAVKLAEKEIILN
ncbi:MAG TPA: Fn3-like domain-containing protein [Ferruginibacter sp.]|nr:Fn3-like domain-containing protein [Ferruginibacter sp.]